MSKSKQLTVADRRVIEILLKEKYKYLQIAIAIQKCVSTVSREIKKHSTPAGYFADIAQLDYESNRSRCRKPKKLDDTITKNYIINKLSLGWSPQQISGRIKSVIDTETASVLCVCTESIYQWIYNDNFCVSQKMSQFLRYGKKRRTKHLGRKSKKQIIPNKVSIHDRPAIVSQHIEFGHWEGDSVVYPSKKAINTLNELFTGLVAFTKLDRKTAELTSIAISDALSKYSSISLTLDNGSEFTKHEDITANTGTKIFFCDPYSSYQRGSNENTNGLLRRYLPKRFNIDELTQQELDDIAWELNTRPRKRLGYLSPIEYYEKFVLSLSIDTNVAFEYRI